MLLNYLYQLCHKLDVMTITRSDRASFSGQEDQGYTPTPARRWLIHSGTVWNPKAPPRGYFVSCEGVLFACC